MNGPRLRARIFTAHHRYDQLISIQPRPAPSDASTPVETDPLDPEDTMAVADALGRHGWRPVGHPHAEEPGWISVDVEPCVPPTHG